MNLCACKSHIQTQEHELPSCMWVCVDNEKHWETWAHSQTDSHKIVTTRSRTNVETRSEEHHTNRQKPNLARRFCLDVLLACVAAQGQQCSHASWPCGCSCNSLHAWYARLAVSTIMVLDPGSSYCWANISDLHGHPHLWPSLGASGRQAHS